MSGYRESAALSAAFGVADLMRQVQGDSLELFGYGPRECAYRIIASVTHWRLRDYCESCAGAPVLIVAAPIKRPYIWDLAPLVSPVRHLLRRGLHVFLLEWVSPLPGHQPAGLDTYGDSATADCVARISVECGKAPILLGHSLGGTLAAIYAALDPQRIRGLVLLGAPLCFQPRSSQFRDAVAGLAPLLLTRTATVPGSAISQISAMAAPRAFVWSRMTDAALTSFDPHAAEIRTRVERWALDEVPLSGLFVHQVLQWLYHDNRLCRGTLRLRETDVGPSTVRVPTLAVVNTADEVAPRASIEPFLDRMPEQDVRLLEFAGETGVGLQHVALLVGRRAHAEVWPVIDAWLERHG